MRRSGLFVGAGGWVGLAWVALGLGWLGYLWREGFVWFVRAQGGEVLVLVWGLLVDFENSEGGGGDMIVR